MDRILTKASDLLDPAAGWIDGLAESAAATSVGANLWAVWTWWAGLFDTYAWMEIGAFVAPALAIVVAVMFWAITRLHLHG